MKLLIEIADFVYDSVNFGETDYKEHICNAIRNGTSIPDNATNGDVIKALYPNRTFFNEASCCVTMRDEDTEYLTYIDFDGDWWNSPYKGGGQENDQSRID